MEWLARHPEDWNQIKNKRCRVLIKKTKEFCKANRPHAAELEAAVKTMLQVAKDIRKKGKIDELKPYVMELSGFPSDDLDRTSINDKIEGGRLVNFEKRRKEYDLLKTIATLQDSCRDSENFKNLEITPIFKTWISFVQIESTGSSIDSSIQSESDEAHSSDGRRKPAVRHVSSEALSPETPQPLATSNSKSFSEEFGQSLMVRISVEDAACSAGINYRTIRIFERDRVSNLIVTTLDKFNLSTTNVEKWKLLQRTDDGKELNFPNNSAIFHCVSGYTGIIMLIVKRKSNKEIETEDLNKQQRRKRLLPQDNLAVTSKLM
ncbi:Oidioi.mRNA.OKI2018_I69.PAR.g10489.t1.cds [Oikopleura dioica]|uniref:Oidioi.mRNA.OKI2018_I69.PAR.g10489.t1.cds n=1 Tax=Oikopleura dioica TaxID=34765 RepID=A0ABN7RR29_OIKDI|nr:Oidioi.mRNA.OKI2018_I69.PAR.g10489.t1.cds [Oikopleura dioica]